jgi:hypothetical protein
MPFQQHPLKMAQLGVEAIARIARGGEKPSITRVTCRLPYRLPLKRWSLTSVKIKSSYEPCSANRGHHDACDMTPAVR